MATRPFFLPCTIGSYPMVLEQDISFTWVPGMAHSQKQKNVRAFHQAIQQELPNSKILEISSKSTDLLGVELSAFNLMLPGGYSVEAAYQAGKIFEGNIGPFPELLTEDAHTIRKSIQSTGEGKKIIGFSFDYHTWPTTPTRLFYNWLYCKALHANPKKSAKLADYTGFTDIEFNPKKSVNCQAYAAALYLSLARLNRLEEALSTPEAFQKYHPKDFNNTPLLQKQPENYIQDSLF